jgi:hypothetical protein
MRKMIVPILAALVATVASAQQTIQVEGPGRWAPDGRLDIALSGDRVNTEARLTEAQMRDLSAVLGRISNVFRSAPALDPPIGFHPRFSFQSGYRWEQESVPGRDPIPLWADLALFRINPDCPDCPIGEGEEARANIEIWMNDIEALFSTGEVMQDGRKMYVVPRTESTEHGFPVYEGGLVVITRRDAPLGLPVSREQYLRNWIDKSRAESAAGKERIESASPEAMEEKVGRMHADVEQAIAKMEEIDPAAAAKMREELARSEAETPAAMEEQKPALEQARAQGMSQYDGLITSVEKELAAMTPEQRRSPARVLGSTGAGSAMSDAAGLVISETEGNPVLFLNPDFFDRSLPRTTIQLIVLRSVQGGDPSAAMANDPVTYGFRRNIDATLDWRALQAILR